MNKSSLKEFNLIDAIKYLKKNDKAMTLILNDIKNDKKDGFNNKINGKTKIKKNKLYNIISNLTPTNSTSSTKTNITDIEIPNYKIKTYSVNYDHNNNDNDNESNIYDNEFQNSNKKFFKYYNHNTIDNISMNLKNNSIKLNKISTSYDSNKKKYNQLDYKDEEFGRRIYNLEKQFYSKLNSLNISLSTKNLIKIEDILFISERIDVLLKKINELNFDNDLVNDNYANQECFEYLSFYFNSTLLDRYYCYFNKINHLIIKSTNNLEIFCIILTYHLSINQKYYKIYKSIFGKIFPLIKDNFILIIKKILSEIYLHQDSNYFTNKSLYLTKINKIINDNISNEYSEKRIISIIIKNSKTIVEFVKELLSKYQNENPILVSELMSLFNNISKLQNETFKQFFYDKILYIPDKNGSIINYSIFNSMSIMNIIKIPYIKVKSNKKYTLVLDLDETLVFVKFLNDKEKGILHFRPYLFDFLNCLLPFYELISFTTATRSYADSILNSIEENKKYFSYKFYREHAIIQGNNLIKDISRLGRDMSKILLIDNMSLNFQHNKENGILIYPFYNENYMDTSLIELKKILIKIYFKNYDDIREAIKDFENEIILNVSCNNNYIN